MHSRPPLILLGITLALVCTISQLACARSLSLAVNEHNVSEIVGVSDDDSTGGYYQNIDHNAKGEELRKQLTALVSKHKVISYAALWSAFVELDKVAGDRTHCRVGTMNDVYSANCWKYSQEQCGNFRAEGGRVEWEWIYLDKSGEREVMQGSFA